jgi:hypothetical protein
MAPILDTMVAYLGLQAGDTSGTTLTNDRIHFPISVHPLQGFVTQSAFVLYDFNDPTWLNDSVGYLLAGPAANAVDDFTTARNKNPGTYTTYAGLSPFSTFDIDFSGLPPYLAKTAATPTEIVLVMGLETEALSSETAAPASNLDWVSTCAPAATTAARPAH